MSTRTDEATTDEAERHIQDHIERMFQEELEAGRRQQGCRKATELYNRYRAFMKKPGFKGAKEMEEELNKIAAEKCSKK
jgi:hypothetical protein